MIKILARAAVGFVATFLAGCLEFGGRMHFAADGSARVVSEIGILKEFANEMAKEAARAKRSGKKAAQAEAFDFGKICKDLITQMPDTAPKPSGVPPPKAPTGTALSTRGKYRMCTVVETIADPAAHYDAFAKAYDLSPSFGRFERLPTGDGYRYTSTLRLSDMLAADKTLDASEIKLALDMAKSLLSDQNMVFTMYGARVENTNGAVSSDGTAVTWRIPMAQLLDLRPDAEPVVSRADIYFR